MFTVGGAAALASQQSNPLRRWNAPKGGSAGDGVAAADRIFKGLAQIGPSYAGPKLAKDAPIFAMGSCFAREIETHLSKTGYTVTSTGDPIRRPEFHDGQGGVRPRFCNRFTPRSMWQEFKQCLGELPSWSDRTSLLFPLADHPDEVVDLNYWAAPGMDRSLRATLVRREVLRGLVRRALDARLIVLTLGLTEAWFHTPTGLYCNSASIEHFAERPEDVELRVLDVPDTTACLDGIVDMLERHHTTGDFDLVLTVSPIPLKATFTGQDIVVANAESKATLRAAAGPFAASRDRVHYFPSLEMVNHSDPALAWGEDMRHVTPAMVGAIVRSFTGSFFG